MLHALDLTRSFQVAKTPWQAVSKNDNEAMSVLLMVLPRQPLIALGTFGVV